MKNKGFTLIEVALVLLVGGIVMSGFLNLLTTATANRQTAVQREAVDTVKANAILQAVNAKTTTSVCGGSGCTGLLNTLDCPLPLGSCRMLVSTYAVPATTTAVNDFWGNPLVYTRVTASVTSTTPPATVVFTVTSRGSDAIVSADDQVTSVNAGEFMARISRMGF
jgi:prepilin-type N-terminal cleavage/methylation domain-containing protein